MTHTPLRIAVSGASGLVGSALTSLLVAGGHRVVRLVRHAPDHDEVQWDLDRGVHNPRALEGLDGVVHLAGEPLTEGRWTAERKRRIYESRSRGTKLLADALAGLDRPPAVLVSASAIGYYGSRGDAVLDEQSAPGTGFLADTVVAWEAAAAPAAAAGIRVVHPRLGLVLSPAGGLLGRLLPFFLAGVGGRVGDGRQWMSWVSLDDVLDIIHRALTDERLRGPVNAVAPAPVVNAEFTRTLARVLGRPALLPVPAFALRLAFGEMADEALLASTRVRPAVLEAMGYGFRHPALEAALRDGLGR